MPALALQRQDVLATAVQGARSSVEEELPLWVAEARVQRICVGGVAWLLMSGRCEVVGKAKAYLRQQVRRSCLPKSSPNMSNGQEWASE